MKRHLDPNILEDYLAGLFIEAGLRHLPTINEYVEKVKQAFIKDGWKKS